MGWGIAGTPPEERNPCRITQECRKNLSTLLSIFSTLSVITNLYGVYIPSIIFITRDQKGITTRGCKLFTQGPCLSKQREQLFYFNHFYGGRNPKIWDMCKGNLLSCSSNSGGAIYMTRSISKYTAATKSKGTPQADCDFCIQFTSTLFEKLISIVTSLVPHCQECAGS